MNIGIVTTKYGQLQGIDQDGYTVFKGIPYAKPPVGDLRWKAPQAPEAWEGVRYADQFGNRCFQGDRPPGDFYHKEFFADKTYVPPMSEDSLYLNIWTPAGSVGNKLPVAFWIHGGGFTGGFGTEREFDGDAFCQKGVILVTINYRLGALGFLAHSWLSQENEKGLSGNYGILDQVAALKWVYENISGFGGDPSNITVFGQSAGSMSVQTLISSQLTEGMIAKAILQSGGGYNSGLNQDRSLEEAKELGEEFVRLTGATSLAELKALTPEKIQEVSTIMSMEVLMSIEANKQSAISLPFTPIIDGYLLKDGYNTLVDQGRYHNIPYMIGSCQNDIGVTPEMIAKGERSQLYNGCVNWSLAGEKLGRKPSHVYYFSREMLGDDAGAFHSSELWYIFGTLRRCWRPKEEADYCLSEKMVGYWTNFARNGDPNGPGLPEWKPCTSTDPYVHELKG